MAMVRAKRLRLVDDVRRTLEEAILCGDMRPGDRLPVAQIAEEFNVSLTTVREALLMLENQGLVVNRPRQGAFVTRLSGQDAYELCQARALLESFAITAGLDQVDAEFIVRLRALLDEMRACTLPQDLPSLIRIDLAIHEAIIGLADSQRIFELWSGLSGQIGGADHAQHGTAGFGDQRHRGAPPRVNRRPGSRRFRPCPPYHRSSLPA